MPDRRTHRGAHPRDPELFAPDRLAGLRAACGDLSWLMGRGYAQVSAVKIVGDRHRLTSRQRLAILRCTCSCQTARERRAKCVPGRELGPVPLAVDGYNLLITIESALAGGVILAGLDGAFRDLASIHGNYRSMAETIPALELIGRYFESLGLGQVRWLLDSPVSNSGRLRGKMVDLARQAGWDWTVDLVHNPDADMLAGRLAVVTSDSVVLDGADRWTNAADEIISRHVPSAWIVDMRA